MGFASPHIGFTSSSCLHLPLILSLFMLSTILPERCQVPLFRLLGGTTTSLSPPIPWFSGHNSWRWTRYEAIRPRVGPRYKSRHMGRLRDRTHQRSWFRTPAFQINHRACWQQWVGSKISVSCNKTHQIAHIRTHQRSCG